MPPDLGWQPLLRLDGAALEAQYRKSLEALGGASGMLGAIFRGARCEIHNPALLKQLIVNLLDDVDWMSLPVDVKGTIYEELVARSAQESSRGAGQYFTPRPVVQAMCEVVQLTPQDRICDPAAGTGGFLCSAYQHVLDRFGGELDRDELRTLRVDLVEGMELSPKCDTELRRCSLRARFLRRIRANRCRDHAGRGRASGVSRRLQSLPARRQRRRRPGHRWPASLWRPPEQEPHGSARRGHRPVAARVA